MRCVQKIEKNARVGLIVVVNISLMSEAPNHSSQKRLIKRRILSAEGVDINGTKPCCFELFVITVPSDIQMLADGSWRWYMKIDN